MHFQLLALFGLMFAVIVQSEHKHDFTKTAKDCMIEMKTDEDTVRSWMTEKGVEKDDEITEKFFECCMRSHMTDTNELIVDDKFITYVTEIFRNRLDGRRNLATLLAKKCIEQCKDIKEDSKGKTAFKTFDCLLNTLHDYLKKDTE